MKNIFQAIKDFFFPPRTATRGRKILPYVVMGVLTMLVFVAGSYGWEYTNSAEFCGTSCHTMPPQYSAYLISPHARVQCVECHIGRDAFASRLTRKAGDLRHVFLNITKQYEYPIQAHNMRPARETCETCHFPEKFSDDSLQELYFYQSNENNTPYNLYLIMRTGGGTAREGLGFGIHWHIENQIQYLPIDDLEQEIPYVRVQNDDGSYDEYFDVSSDLSSEDIDEEELVTMDCITCHNRITHRVANPDEAISQALRKDLISDELPFVVRESFDLLTADYPDKATALESMNDLAYFYSENYPEVYNASYDDVLQAVGTLQDIYNQSVFPDQKMDWDSHPDNLGHQDNPGCFRCHDGKHFSQAGEAVRLECNICHSVPVVSGPTQLTTDIEVTSGPEPVSHTLTTWIALHGRVKDNSCKACHTTPAGVDDLTTLEGKPPADDSFCGNEACHNTVFTYAGFDDPALEPILSAQLEELIAARPPEVFEDTPLTEGALSYQGEIQELLVGRCSACHGDGATGGLDVTTYESLLAGGNNGPGVVPEDLEASLIYVRQTEDSDHYFQFSDEEIALIEEWILAGALEMEP
ncbi:MAG TPA: NapC/NirT family cytochrome c [Anaerolineales bacterium]|nr:NapC/NirT family cytochrome c [Anaerolineales bacterium]